MNYNIDEIELNVNSAIASIVFCDHDKIIIDLHTIFKCVNTKYVKHIEDNFLSFEFTKHNKSLYTHIFLEELFEVIQEQNSIKGSNLDVILYYNSINILPFYLSLIKKIKKWFGFVIIESNIDIDEFYENSIYEKECEYVEKLEVAFLQERKMKNLKELKKFFIRNNMTHLYEKYFINSENKILLFK